MDTLGNSSTCEEVLGVFSTVPESSYNAYKNGTIIVTGANTGIGKPTAQFLAYYGATVVLACRNEEKAKEAMSFIVNADESQDFASKEELEKRMVFIKLDLSSLQSIKDFATHFQNANLPPLRCMVLNAGVYTANPMPTTENFDAHFGINFLGHYYLTKLLLPELRASSSPTSKSRVVVVSSESHMGPFYTTEFTNKEVLRKTIVYPEGDVSGLRNSMKLYGNSKLANVYFAQSIQEKEAGNNIVAVSLHPGSAIPTDMSRNLGSIMGFIMKSIVSWFTKSPNQGSSTTLTCVLAPEEKVAGKYFSDCKEMKVGKEASGDMAKKGREVLWELSEELLAEKGF